MTCKIHPTALVEEGVEIGDETSIWDNVHIRGPSRIGRSCIIGGKSYIAYGVDVGDFVKINSFVYIPTGVTIGDGCMISAGTIFTNDVTPRATDPKITRLQDSGPQETTQDTVLGKGVTIGAGSRIAGGIRIGDFAMIGMGAVVTKDVGAFQLVYGNPARVKGVVSRSGDVLMRGDLSGTGALYCAACDINYRYRDGVVEELCGETV